MKGSQGEFLTESHEDVSEEFQQQCQKKSQREYLEEFLEVPQLAFLEEP